MIDSHTHLHLCEPPDAELVAAAVEAGVTRIVTVGTDGASCRAGAGRRRALPAGLRRHRPPPQRRHRLRRRRPGRARGAGRPRALRGDRRDRPGLLPRLRAGEPISARAFMAQIELAASTGKPLVIHTRAADDDTLDDPRPSTPPGSR